MALNNCSACQPQGKTSTPEVWCPECEESLCSICSQQHKVQKATKGHNTISYENYNKLPPFILNVQVNCEEHNDKYKYYCRSHDCPLCKECLSKTHKKCNETPDIDKAIQNIKTSAVFEDVWRELKKTHQTFLNTIKDRKDNLDKLQKIKEELSTQVKDRTNKLIEQLKKLENETLYKLDLIINENQSHIKATTKILESNEIALKEMLKHEEITKKHASNFQAFIGTKLMERKVRETEDTLQMLSEKGELNNIEIEIKNDNDEGTIFGMTLLGDIKIMKKNSVSIEKDKANRGQAIVEQRFPKQLTLNQQFTLNAGGSYTGCCILSNGLMVAANNDKGVVKILQSNGSLKTLVSLHGGVYDIALMNENYVAVSNPKSQTISIIDTENSKVIKTLQTKSYIRGITHSDGHLLCCVPRKGIIKVNIESEKIDEVHDDHTVDIHSHIDTDSNRICYTCYYKDTITILDQDYRVKFIFNDDNILTGPYDLSIDQHQNIFVCNYMNHNLLLISSDGDKHEVLFNKDDGLCYPRSVHYDRDKKEILLIDYNCEARIFSVK